MDQDQPGRGRHEVRWCFHTTAMVEDYDATRDALARLVGSRALEENLYEDAGIGRRGGMTWIGDNSIELGEPTVEGGAVDRFVKRFGSHMSSIAVQVADIDATVAHLQSVGVRVASRIDEIIVFTDPKTTAGVVIEWYGGESENDPRFGTPIPPYPVEPLLDVTHMAFGGAVVDDPGSAAARLAEVFATDVTFVDPDPAPGAPAAGVSLVDMTLALWPIPPRQESLALWNHVYERAQTSSLGVRVPDLGVALRRLQAAAVALVRHDERSIVIDPAATGGVVVVVVDALPPGDPRRA
ncbi:VOC family protein [Acidiferrimicrobium sp. IK]|uniref:VOC family protein n=1 Tax=Acidiferrimicrobium sp. IK TaxID=2871700 RepID=UPI0021CB968D|nr:VOC family protein [Acidiferrimicrobium sp. IK]MCU4186349.1 VOC family protein [Acidiferrimicrobium sp. IK]